MNQLHGQIFDGFSFGITDPAVDHTFGYEFDDHRLRIPAHLDHVVPYRTLREFLFAEEPGLPRRHGELAHGHPIKMKLAILPGKG